MKNNIKVIDLGCGKNKVKGAIGIDNVELEGVDIVHDLTVLPYPFSDNSIDYLYCRHVLEHFEPTTRDKVISEIGRILKPGGKVEIRVPHAFCIAAFGDPTHKSYYCFQTIKFFTRGYIKSYYKGVYSNFKLNIIWASFLISENSNFPTRIIAKFLNYFFNKLFDFTGYGADIVVKMLPIFSVEILWVLEKY